jgi:uncharacterized protein YdgA (DUF945 family)
MRKLIAIVLIGIPCLMGALLYWGGLRAEQEYQRIVASFAANHRLRMIPVHYERGWLRSKAQMRVELRSSEEKEGESFAVTLDHQIAHGPLALAELLRGRIPTEWVLAVVETKFRPDLEDYPEFAAALGDDPVFTALTTFYPEGYAEAEFSSAAIQKDKDWGALGVYWQGATGTLVVTSGFEHGSGALRSSGLDLVTREARVRIRGIRIEFDLERDAVGLPLGESTLGIDSVQIADAEDPDDSLGFRDLRYVQAMESDGDLFRLRFSVTIGSAKRGDDVYGPAQLELVVRNLDGRALVEYRKRTREIAQSGAPDAQRELALLAAGAELLPRVLSRSPELELAQLRVHGEDGDFEATAHLGVRTDAPDLAVPGPLLGVSAAEAVAEIRVPAAMLHRVAESVMARRFDIAEFAPDAEAAQEMDEAELAAAQENAELAMQTAIDAARGDFVEKLVSMQVLVLEGESYRVKASYAMGQLLLNDVLVDPKLLLGGDEQTLASTIDGELATP